MIALRRRLVATCQNLLAAAVGAVVVCLAKGMSPQEILDYAVSNAHLVPDLLPSLATQILGV